MIARFRFLSVGLGLLGALKAATMAGFDCHLIIPCELATCGNIGPRQLVGNHESGSTPVVPVNILCLGVSSFLMCVL